jgi:hypothetical protein
MPAPKTSARDEELADFVQSLDEGYRELSAKGCVPAEDVERQSNEAIARGLKMREGSPAPMVFEGECWRPSTRLGSPAADG